MYNMSNPPSQNHGHDAPDSNGRHKHTHHHKAAEHFTRMNKKRLLREHKMKTNNEYTEVKIMVDEDTLKNVGLLVSTHNSKHHCTMCVVKASIVPSDDSMPECEKATNLIDDELVDLINKGVYDDKSYMDWKVDLSNYDSMTKMTNKLKKICLRLKFT